MESEENVALLEKQREVLQELQARHLELAEKAEELYEDDPEGSELEEIQNVSVSDLLFLTR